MRSKPIKSFALSLGLLLLAAPSVNATPADQFGTRYQDSQVFKDALKAVRKGRQTFRHDTFGDEAFWTDILKLHDAISGEALGGVGPGVSPVTALAVGLKIDSRALPISVKQALREGQVDLDDPAVTVELLRLGAVVGIEAKVSSSGHLDKIGLTCAFCHSVVDDSFAPGIGRRLDGWANRDLDVGTIISLAPDLSFYTQLLNVDEDTVRKVLQSWGPGKFDATLPLDGKAFRPDGKTSAVLIPPAFGLSGVNLTTWTGWGSITHWNAFVAIHEMGGQGRIYDKRLDNAEKYPLAATNGSSDIRPDVDRVTPKLADLQRYELALNAPKPPPGSYDRAAALRGKVLFNGQADCARCHVPPLFTEPGWNLHTPEEMGIDAFQAKRGPEDQYRTSPLKGLWTHAKGGYFHDGRFSNLLAVIDHYNSNFGLGLFGKQKTDLVEYLKSL